MNENNREARWCHRVPFVCHAAARCLIAGRLEIGSTRSAGVASSADARIRSQRLEDKPGCARWRPCTGGLASRPGYTVPDMDWKIELVAIPVTDADRAKAFYVEQVGFHADHDHQVNDALRFVQLTPPGSACSIVLGTGITEMPPGSQKGVQCVVADVEAARRELIAHGVQASDADVQPWGPFVTFSDPDGNTWALQQLPPRP
jgi:catechol 2,3-dioxygenase-like lactoylglutathione lyase family enzyme